MFYLSRQPIVQLKIFSEENLSGLIYLHLQGYKNVEIAKMVPFTAQTIGTHVRNYKKYGLEGLTHAQNQAVRRNFHLHRKLL